MSSLGLNSSLALSVGKLWLNISETQLWLTADIEGVYNTNVRLLATCSITIMNEQNHNVENNHNYKHDYICLETSSERKQISFAWFDVSIFQTTYDINECNKRNY